ncbi:MAG: hypothetical protein WCF22_15630 [Candidatus Sulfotelmatobacter sp.]
MTKEVFTDSQLRLQWAQEEFTDFQRGARIYFKRTPRLPFIEPDPDGIHEHHKLKLGKPLPGGLAKRTVHTIENLRAALELTAIAIARLTRPIGAPVDDVHFPFCKTANDFKSRIGSCCKGFPEKITDLFGSFEPYGATDNLLFAINELCNASKHRIIVPNPSVAGVRLPYIEMIGGTGPVVLNEGNFFDVEKNEITYATTERGVQLKYRAQFGFDIAFGEVGPLKGHSVATNLDGMIRAVTTVIDKTEAKCGELGLFS